MKKSRLHFVFLLLGVFFVSASLLINTIQEQTLGQMAGNAALRIEWKQKSCISALDSVSSRLTKDIKEPDRFFEKEGIALYFFKNKKLVYWNNSNLPFDRDLKAFISEKGFVKLTYGYYLYERKNYDSLEALALCLLKPQYPLQNNYLDNSFEAWTGIAKGIELDDKDQAYEGVTVKGQRWFGLKSTETAFYSQATDHFCLVLFMLGFILLLLSALAVLKAAKPLLWYWCILGGVILLRALMLFFKWPFFFYRSVLYDVRLFGNAQSTLNGYLGDILLNAILLFFISLSVYFYFERKRSNSILPVSKAAILLFLLFNQYNQTLVSLVTNSTLSFNFTDIFNVKIPVFVALLAVAFYSLGILLSLVILVRSFGKGPFSFFGFIMLILGITLLQYFTSITQNYFEMGWLCVVATIVYACYQLPQVGTGLLLGVQVILISIVTSVFLNYYIEKDQNQELDILSLKLSEKADAILENEYNGLPHRIGNDENLWNLINLLPASKEAIDQNLKQKFFSGYFERYTIEFSLFDADCKPLLNPKQAILLNEGFFEDKIRFFSDSVSPGLFFVKDNRKSSQYIGRIKIKNHNLYALMEPKQFEEVGSFPDLLLDQSLQKQDKLKNFSYVIYQQGQSTGRYGNFNYPYFLQDSTTLSKTNDNFTHFYFRPDETTEIVISKGSKNWSYFFTFNSYLLLFFSLITYSCYLVYARIFTSLFRNSSLTRRIQTIIVFLLLVAMSAVGVTSGKLVIKQFEADNKLQLHEKTDIIISELSNQYSSTQLFDESQKELLNLRIKEYSRLFSTPISLFNNDGSLYTTSEPKLYDYGLASSLVNARAFYNLSNNRLSSVSVNEKAGALKYLSYYTPLFDSQKQMAGFINLPYFAKQSDLTDELSGIISALINVYVILFVLSIVAGLILAGYITRPLQLIKQQFSKITLGKQNEKLHWPANDEIGKLVFEYNQMLTKLEESANLLARSEREGAWREMAKQVAHEIKNPLTPMKLNLQYLQHLMKNNPEDFKDKFERASSGIIEQIDSLANIATEFSNFAKLPQTRLGTIELADVINASVSTFANQENIAIRNNILAHEVFVKGDKDQCLRVFNNIFKNAVQALEDCPQPFIEITLTDLEDKVLVVIRDNGCGIDELQKEKIFTPNFTTKTTGSGLGLAMVQNIMTGFGGKIWFESEKDSGTIFYLEFVRVSEN